MSRIGRFTRALRSEGVRSTLWRVAKWVWTRRAPFRATPLASVYLDDVVAVDWTHPRLFNQSSIAQPAGGYRVAWIITPPGRTSGGHQNAFRFMSFLEKAGHQLTVYLYSPSRYPVVSIPEIKRMMQTTSAYPELQAEFLRYDPAVGIQGEFDAIMASDWESSYAAYRYPGPAKRFYFVQDYEPAFFPAGSDSVIAENSYRLGFHGFSAGRWLAQKLRDEFAMSCDYYDYAVDTSLYHRTGAQRRTEVLMYVRPPTPRRATEFGLLALLEMHRRRPEIVINLVGWDMSDYPVPFPYVNHSAVDIARLNDIYNRCAAGLVLSLTNMSLLPMEMMSAGVVPIVNEGANTRGFFDSPYLEYAAMTPRSIADLLIAAVDRPDAIEYSEIIAKSVADTDWQDPGSVFIEQFVRAMTESRP